jgi:hypothetical protein
MPMMEFTLPSILMSASMIVSKSSGSISGVSTLHGETRPVRPQVSVTAAAEPEPG